MKVFSPWRLSATILSSYVNNVNYINYSSNIYTNYVHKFYDNLINYPNFIKETIQKQLSGGVLKNSSKRRTSLAEDINKITCYILLRWLTFDIFVLFE